jgi:hypothetical protein
MLMTKSNKRTGLFVSSKAPLLGFSFMFPGYPFGIDNHRQSRRDFLASASSV